MDLQEINNKIDHLTMTRDIEGLMSLRKQIQNSSASCADSEKSEYEDITSKIERITLHTQYLSQIQKLKDYSESRNPENAIKAEYTEAYKYPGIDIEVGGFYISSMFRSDKNEVWSRLYMMMGNRGKQFVLRKDLTGNDYPLLQKLSGEHYSFDATPSNWADVIIGFIQAIEKNTVNFRRMLGFSCPFYSDGTHMLKSWRTYATVTVGYESDTQLIQGVKKGESVQGAQVVGDNGSYRVWNKGLYVIRCTVDRMAYEMPIRHKYVYEMDDYLRGLKERLGYKNMPYEKLNGKLTRKIEVETRDMDHESENRFFYPVGYNNNWVEYLKQTLEPQR